MRARSSTVPAGAPRRREPSEQACSVVTRSRLGSAAIGRSRPALHPQASFSRAAAGTGVRVGPWHQLLTTSVPPGLELRPRVASHPAPRTQAVWAPRRVRITVA
ncbi:hypothetical protein NDU88_001510 [Pleurodeles waltl]|uniref:Uncharacterized protein n=1 Tax=Pleurodeles waltl TaxID=8319 RepID=A0AAV7MMW6_PLEWA|nr:hypothetical protein NDU88_001510 [Pleurodeles waltl]